MNLDLLRWFVNKQVVLITKSGNQLTGILKKQNIDIYTTIFYIVEKSNNIYFDATHISHLWEVSE